LADNVLGMVKTMNELKGTFQKQEIANQVHLQKKLRNMEYFGNKKLSEFLFELEKTISELKNCGGNINYTGSYTVIVCNARELSSSYHCN